MPAGVPTVTLGATASSKEIWNMFWLLSSFLNSSVSLSVGADGTISPGFGDRTSFRHTQIGFGPTGHDHGNGGVHSRGLTKRNFDLNGLKALWYDYWDEGSDNQFIEHFVPCSGKTSVVVSGGVGRTELPIVPSATNSDLDLYGSWYDQYFATWTTWPVTTLGYIVTSATSLSTTGLAYIEYDTAAAKWYVVVVGADTTYTVNFMLINKYLGTFPLD